MVRIHPCAPGLINALEQGSRESGGRMAQDNRFWIAMGVYVVLAAVEWLTLEGRVRWVALAVLALFAVRTVIHDRRRALELTADRDRLRE